MSRVSLVPAAVLAALTAGCAAALNVSSHRAPSYEWSTHPTFAWAEPDSLPTGDPRLTGNRAFGDWMHGAVISGLLERGWTESGPATAAVHIHYHANVSTRFDVARVDQSVGSCPGGQCAGQTL